MDVSGRWTEDCATTTKYYLDWVWAGLPRQNFDCQRRAAGAACLEKQ